METLSAKKQKNGKIEEKFCNLIQKEHQVRSIIEINVIYTNKSTAASSSAMTCQPVLTSNPKIVHDVKKSTQYIIDSFLRYYAYELNDTYTHNSRTCHWAELTALLILHDLFFIKI